MIGPLEYEAGHPITLKGERYHDRITMYFVTQLEFIALEQMLCQQDGATRHTPISNCGVLFFEFWRPEYV